MPSNYFIGIVQDQDSPKIAFNDTSSDEEITFYLNVTKERASEIKPLKVYDYITCNNITYGNNIVEATTNNTDVTPIGNFDRVPASIDIKTANLTDYIDTGFYTEHLNNTARIKFCVRADLGEISYSLSNGTVSQSSISFVKAKFDISFDLTAGFSSANLQLEEVDAEETNQDISFPGKTLFSLNYNCNIPLTQYTHYVQNTHSRSVYVFFFDFLCTIDIIKLLLVSATKPRSATRILLPRTKTRTL